MIKFVMTKKQKKSTKGDSTMKKITALEAKRKEIDEILGREGGIAIEELHRAGQEELIQRILDVEVEEYLGRKWHKRGKKPMEYVYSIMERGRLAAFIGDKMLAMPFILFVGSEVWKTKEAKESSAGQGINWELTTAVSMLQAGADLLVMRHPEAVMAVEKYIKIAMNRGGNK